MYTYTYNNPINVKDPDGRANFFIGGAFDPAKGSKSIIKTGARQLTNGFSGKFQSSYQSKFYTHSQAKQTYERKRVGKNIRRGKKLHSSAFNDIVKMHKANPKESINIVGHSWGGANALELQNELSDAGINVDLLITLDPVSVFDGRDGLSKGSSTTWINLFIPDASRPDSPSDWGKVAAKGGGAWGKQSGASLNVPVTSWPGQKKEGGTSGHVGIVFKPLNSYPSVKPHVD